MSKDKEPRKDIFFVETSKLTIPEKGHRLYDELRREEPVREELVISILTIGFLPNEPLLVVHEGPRGGGANYIDDGLQRYKAHCEANNRIAEAIKRGETFPASPTGEPLRIPVVYTEGDIGKLYSQKYAANSHRLAESPITIARKAVVLEDAGKSLEEIAHIGGIDPATIRRYKRLLNLPMSVQLQVHKGQLAAAAALELEGVPEPEVKTILEESVKETPTLAPVAQEPTLPGVVEVEAKVEKAPPPPKAKKYDAKKVKAKAKQAKAKAKAKASGKSDNEIPLVTERPSIREINRRFKALDKAKGERDLFHKYALEWFDWFREGRQSEKVFALFEKFPVKK